MKFFEGRSCLECCPSQAEGLRFCHWTMIQFEMCHLPPPVANFAAPARMEIQRRRCEAAALSCSFLSPICTRRPLPNLEVEAGAGDPSTREINEALRAIPSLTFHKRSSFLKLLRGCEFYFSHSVAQDELFEILHLLH
jgi:hypothetical protein